MKCEGELINDDLFMLIRVDPSSMQDTCHI